MNLNKRDEAKSGIKPAQEAQKEYVDSKRTDKQFEVSGLAQVEATWSQVLTTTAISIIRSDIQNVFKDVKKSKI